MCDAPASGITSIVLPTFNRARFLPRAFDAIRSQEYDRWELIVVDDGSVDATESLVTRFASTQPVDKVRYHHQSNRGAYAARNVGLDMCRGEYIAFYDSDDVWLSHHLSKCVSALERHPDVDWVYGACRMVDEASGKEIQASTFHQDGMDEAFLTLKVQQDRDLFIVRDERALEWALLHGLNSGLQNSMFRARVFNKLRFRVQYGSTILTPQASSRSAEDQLLVARALAAGFILGYRDDVHVNYYVHAGNSSAASSVPDLEKTADVFRTLIAGFEALRQELPSSSAIQTALSLRLSREYFWHLGYGALWPAGRFTEAIAAYERGLRLNPRSLRLWKTYVAARVRLCLSAPESVRVSGQ